MLTTINNLSYKPILNHGLGAVLGQLKADGNKNMCACISRSLNKHEANYSSYKGEMLATVWAAKMFRPHLYRGQAPSD